MATTKYIQTNFTSGEFSDKMLGRVDFQRYYNAVRVLRNFLPQAQGGVSRRPGFNFVDYPKYSDKKCRLIPYEYGAYDTFIIEVGHQYMRFFRDGYLIRQVSGSNLITNGDFASDLTGWTDYSVSPGSATWSAGQAALDGGATGVGSIGQSIATTVGKTYVLTFDLSDNAVHLRIGTTAQGSEIIYDVEYATAGSKQMSFIARTGTTYIQFLRKSNGAAKIDNVVCKLYEPVEISSPYTEDEIDDLMWTQDTLSVYLVHPAYWPRRLTRVSDVSWTLETLDNNTFFRDGPFFAEEETPAITPTWKGPSVNKVTNGEFNTDTAWTKGANWTISGGKALKSAGGLNNLSQDTTEAAAEIYLVTYTIDSITGGSLTVSVGGVGGTARSSPGTYSQIMTATGTGDLTFTPSHADVVCQIDNVSSYRLTSLTAGAALWQADHLGASWRIKQGTATDPTTWVWGTVRIVSYVSSTNVLAFVEKVMKDTSASIGQREGRWSTVRGFPASITFHENRLMFGGASTSPQTFWGSATEEPYNMSPGANDADAIAFTLGSNKISMIRWITSGHGLVIGTHGNLFRNSASPITPTNVQISAEGTEGATRLMPLVIGPSIIFVEKAGEQVIEATYSYDSDSYETENLSLVADHETLGGVEGMVYQQGLNPIIWMWRPDGLFIALTYKRSQKVAAWSHHITDGYVESMAVVPNIDERIDDVFAVVKRNINGSDVRCIEYLNPYLNVDCGLCGSFASPVTKISGLEHMIGESVRIVGDDAVYPSQIVDANGQITLDPAAQDIEVGLGYTAYLETLRPEVQEGSTIQPCKKRWSEIYVRLFETIGLKVNEEVIPFRTSLDKMDEGITPYTGDKQVFNLGWEEEAVLKIEQYLPLPATILCIFGTLEINAG